MFPSCIHYPVRYNLFNRKLCSINKEDKNKKVHDTSVLLVHDSLIVKIGAWLQTTIVRHVNNVASDTSKAV